MSTARVLSVFSRLRGMPVSGVSVVRGFLVVASIIVLRSLLVVLRGVSVMFRRFAVVIGSFF